MRWPWQQRIPAGEPEPGRSPMARRIVTGAEELPACLTCGALLGLDPEDEPDGEGPGRPICGECNRARNFDVLFER